MKISAKEWNTGLFLNIKKQTSQYQVTFICHSLDKFSVTILKDGYIKSFDCFNLISHEHKKPNHHAHSRYPQLFTNDISYTGFQPAKLQSPASCWYKLKLPDTSIFPAKQSLPEDKNVKKKMVIPVLIVKLKIKATMKRGSSRRYREKVTIHSFGYTLNTLSD